MTIAILFASIFTALNPFHTDDRVATASLVFHVSDDRGAPVENAKVEVFFDMLYEPSETVSVNTDSNGVCRAKGKTVGMMKFRVLKEDYYSTHGEIILIAAGQEHEKRKGKWQPWDMEQKVVLAKIRNPIAEQTPQTLNNWRNAPNTNAWMGFDVRVNDFVSPWGKGEIADFEVRYEWNGKMFNDFDGMTTTLRFPDKDGGGYWFDRFPDSDLRGTYSADPDAKYIQEFVFYTKFERDSKGRKIKRVKREFPSDKNLVCRSRCKYDENGILKEASYFQILKIQFTPSTKGVGIRCYVAYNPTPNDTNIEPK